MTDIWCFTCSHEIKLNFVGGYVHIRRDDEDGCVRIDDEEGCAP